MDSELIVVNRATFETSAQLFMDNSTERLQDKRIKKLATNKKKPLTPQIVQEVSHYDQSVEEHALVPRLTAPDGSPFNEEINEIYDDMLKDGRVKVVGARGSKSKSTATTENEEHRVVYQKQELTAFPIHALDYQYITEKGKPKMWSILFYGDGGDNGGMNAKPVVTGYPKPGGGCTLL